MGGVGEVRVIGFGAIAIADVAGDVEGVDIDFVEAFLHGGVVNFVGGIGEVAGDAGEATGHVFGLDDADVAVFVDEVEADEELVGLGVDHAVGVGAADAFWADDLFEVGGDFVKFV